MVSEPSAGWTPFERDPADYEAWYDTPRGRRADRAERALIERLLQPLGTPRSALEVGCGTGHFTRWLDGRLPSVFGLDRAPTMVAEARRRAPDLVLVIGDAHALPMRNRAVDVTVFVLVLEFLERPSAGLAEAARVSRRGVLALALNRWSLGGLSRRYGRDAGRPRLGRARDFTLPSLCALMSDAAGPRLRALRWASALFPAHVFPGPARLPLGGVLGVAVELRP